MTRHQPRPYPPLWLVRVVIVVCVLTACIALADTLCRCAGLDGCGWLSWTTTPLRVPE